MPYLVIDGESIDDKLREPKFHLITFSNDVSGSEATSAEIEAEYAGLVDHHAFLLDPAVAEVFGTTEAFSVLLRPDNYVAFVSHETSVSQLNTYLNSVDIRRISQRESY